MNVRLVDTPFQIYNGPFHKHCKHGVVASLYPIATLYILLFMELLSHSHLPKQPRERIQAEVKRGSFV